MYKLFFEDSSISFLTAAKESCGGVISLHAEETLCLAKMLEKLENYKHLCIECSDPKSAFESFAKNFRLVEAAGGVVESSRGGVLMIFRNGRWDLPKGHVESGEEFSVAAAREVEEETGVSNLQIEGHLTNSYHTYKLNGEWILKRTWWYRMSTPTEQKPTPQKEEQITKAEWVERSRVGQCAESSFASVRQVLTEALNRE